ncbi:hypothetical protein [Nocardia terpenica]|uniref:Uncharacterized protein n=1 Tax=Nocardia terpenica TaxID=455432 RepID=A0A164K6W7_9NOCA|nr:hypothetical protein [Nocardia terpenica]KZM71097.1 hypothetical protein AWN90_42045 [Nocardia terpenica]NQE89576.1 hypothetical protein [Nocardia terpenica]
MAELALHEIVQDDLSRSVFFDRNPGAEVLRPLVDLMAQYGDDLWHGLFLELADKKLHAKQWAEAAFDAEEPVEIMPNSTSRFLRETDQIHASAVDRVETARAALDLILHGPNEDQE